MVSIDYRVMQKNVLCSLKGTRNRFQDIPACCRQDIQVDVKFLKFKSPNGKVVKRFQYTAIDDATRIRALKIYNRHTQENAIHFIDYVINKFPFRIHTIRTDNGHEFQAKFHWHVPVYQPGREDLGIHHVYIKPPCLPAGREVQISMER